MKLSQMSTDKALDVMCEITPYVTNIVTDEDLIGCLKNAIDPRAVNSKAEMIAAGAAKLTEIAKIVLQKRKSDVYGILGALNGKTAEEIAEQNGVETMKQIRDIIKDKELLDFFRSCASSEGSE